MKKLTKILLVCTLVLALGGSALSSALAITVSQALKDLKQKNVCDVITLRARVSELEGTLGKGLSALADKAAQVFAPAEDDGNGENDGQAVEAPAGEQDPDRVAGEVTLNEAHAAEPAAEPSADPSADPEAAPYVVAEYRGIIGVFDGEGNLLRTVNVSISTLPDADRAALADGIQAMSWQDMMDIVGQYQ